MMGDPCAGSSSFSKGVPAEINTPWQSYVTTIKTEQIMEDGSCSNSEHDYLVSTSHINYSQNTSDYLRVVKSETFKNAIYNPMFQCQDPLSIEGETHKIPKRRGRPRETPEKKAQRLAMLAAHNAHRLSGKPSEQSECCSFFESETAKKTKSIMRHETPEHRAIRLAKMSAYSAERLANESPEERAFRLSQMSQYAAKRLSQETTEQRSKRLARMSAYAAKRLAEESPEKRKARLERMSAYAARRQAIKKFKDSKHNFLSLSLGVPGSPESSPTPQASLSNEAMTQR